MLLYALFSPPVIEFGIALSKAVEERVFAINLVRFRLSYVADWYLLRFVGLYQQLCSIANEQNTALENIEKIAGEKLVKKAQAEGHYYMNVSAQWEN